MKSIVNYRESSFTVGIFDSSIWDRIREKFIRFYSNQRIKEIRLLYRELFKKEFGGYPTDGQFGKFLNLYVNNNEKLGVKYSAKKFLEAVNKSVN